MTRRKRRMKMMVSFDFLLLVIVVVLLIGLLDLMDTLATSFQMTKAMMMTTTTSKLILWGDRKYAGGRGRLTLT